MKPVSEHIPGYSYGTAQVAPSPVSMRELEELKISAGFTEEDERYLRLAGEMLADKTKWCKSIQLQLVLWVHPYMEAGKAATE